MHVETSGCWKHQLAVTVATRFGAFWRCFGRKFEPFVQKYLRFIKYALFALIAAAQYQAGCDDEQLGSVAKPVQ